MKNGKLKISKGYRLKLSTHQLIKNLKEITQADSDTVLNRSCKLYYKTILEQDEKSIINNESEFAPVIKPYGTSDEIVTERSGRNEHQNLNGKKNNCIKLSSK